MRTQRTKVKRAFTLIEILIVVVILGILAAIIIPQFSESAEGARTSAANSSLQTVRAQVELYKFKEGENPANGNDFADLVAKGYLTEFNQPDGHCISVTDGLVTMATNPCP